MPRRRVISLALIIGFLAVVLAAVSPGHSHAAQKPHSCSICQVSLTPATAADIRPVIWPPIVSEHTVTVNGASHYDCPQLVSGPSRAPPRA